MSPQTAAHISVSLTNIHRIITRGLEVSMKSAAGASRHGFQDEGSKIGLFNYIQALVSVLDSHHQTEDELVFPYFKEILPDARYDLLVAEHEQMVRILEEVDMTLEKCRQGDALAAGLHDLADALSRLEMLWNPHIQVEADDLLSKADALLPVEEQLRLVKMFAEHGQKHAGPPFLTVPFLLFNLEQEDRAIFSQGMPGEVLEHLVPVVWKPQWESMKPYLLD